MSKTSTYRKFFTGEVFEEPGAVLRFVAWRISFFLQLVLADLPAAVIGILTLGFFYPFFWVITFSVWRYEMSERLHDYLVARAEKKRGSL